VVRVITLAEAVVARVRISYSTLKFNQNLYCS
jgi:hypothetical protein